MGSLSGLWVSSVGVPTAMYSYFTSPRGAQPSERRRQPWCSLHIPYVPALESSLGKMVVMLKSSASSNAHSYQCLEAVSADMGDKHERPLLACPKAGKTAKTHRGLRLLTLPSPTVQSDRVMGVPLLVFNVLSVGV